jgi:ribosomal protein L12E/L44/L45/RPP1/RPP2
MTNTDKVYNLLESLSIEVDRLTASTLVVSLGTVDTDELFDNYEELGNMEWLELATSGDWVLVDLAH